MATWIDEKGYEVEVEDSLERSHELVTPTKCHQILYLHCSIPSGLASCPSRLAIGPVFPTLAQQKVIADPRIVQQRDLLGTIKALGEFGELDLKLDEAYNNDAAAS